ncbi:hypothetical protein G9A89_008423 [Geosiphon pyriformis]|nr:hypothetical protein G9A89_008423 [Geosiphon pyriformis]
MENKEIKRTTRPESHDFNDYTYNCLNYYEWIPWARLSNINEIARGGFGIIYKATWVDGRIDTWSIRCNDEMKYKREGTVEVAIKIIKTNSLEVFKELNIGRAIFINTDDKDYFCISEIIGITQNAETLEYGIFMDFAKRGDMRKYLSTNFHSKSWFNKLVIACKIAEGLSQIHSSGMVHRDLHSGNILQLYEYEVNIGDLGLCQPCWDPNPKNRPTAEEVWHKLLDIYKWVVKDTDEVSIIEEFKTVDFQFRESEKYLKEMAESDDSTTTIQSTTTRIHPGAVYTSRVFNFAND